MASVDIGRDSVAAIYGYNATYATTVSTAAGLLSSWNIVGQRAFPSPAATIIYRSFYRFDTSSLDGYTVTKVNLSMAFATGGFSPNFDVLILKADWSALYPLTTGNMDAAYDLAASAAQDNNIWRNTSGMSFSTVYQSGDLSTSWVNTSGYTYYAVRSSRDGTEPSGDEFLSIGSPSTANLKLTIEYTEGGGGSSTPIHLIRTGMQPGMRIGL